MHGKVLRGGLADLSLRLLCITRPTGYIPFDLYIHCAPLLVCYPPTPSSGGFGRAGVFFFEQYYIFTILNMIKIFNLNLSDLDSTLFCYFSGCGPLAPSWYNVSSHLYHMSFYHFSECGPLAPGWYSVGSYSGCGPLTLGWYSVGSHLYYILFYHFSGCGPLAPGWYSIGSHLY
jgi:hypothetical protein